MRLLFITHNTHRAGAPIVLLEYLRWLRKYYASFYLSVLDLQEGALKPEFVEVSDQYISLNRLENTTNNSVLKRFKNYASNKKNHNIGAVLSRFGSEHFDIIYANTVKSIPYGVLIKNTHPHAKLIGHIHELPTVIKLLLPDFNTYVEKLDRVIAVSKMVEEKLIQYWHIPAEKITQVYAFSDVPHTSQSARSISKVFHVGASGLADWRKGYDVFVQVARYVHKHYPDIDFQFTWVGAISQTNRIIIEDDLDKLGLKDKVVFVGELSNPFEVYNTFDVFLLCSREDPFPLVCIEMARLKKPIICFENATGITEIINDGGGSVVAYLDIEAMAEVLVNYYHEPAKKLEHGEMAFELFSRFNAEVICEELFKVVQEVYASGKGKLT